MKKFLSIPFFLSGCLILSNAAAQKKTTRMLEKKIANFSCSYIMGADAQKSDTVYFVNMSFQNMEYQAITDIKSIALFTNEDLKQFISDLDSAINNTDADSDMDWSNNRYRISKWKGKKYLVFFNETGKAYTTLTTNKSAELSEWLKQIELGKIPARQ